MTLAEKAGKQLTAEEKSIRLESLEGYWGSLGINTANFNSIKAAGIIDEVWVATNGEHQFDLVVFKMIKDSSTVAETSVRVFPNEDMRFRGEATASIVTDVLSTKRTYTRRTCVAAQTFIGVSEISLVGEGVVLTGNGFGVRITREGIFSQHGVIKR